MNDGGGGADRPQVSRRPLVIIVAIAVALVLLAAIFPGASLIPALVIAAVIVIPVMFTFTRLTVTVGADEVRAAFGRGWPKRTIRHADIVSATPVQNSWWHGWGIRFISGGSMYNVAGLEAVELVLASGKKFRIGTDQPAELANAINVRLGAR